MHALLLLPALLAPASVPSQAPPPKTITVAYPLSVDIDGDGTADPVSVEYVGFTEGCANQVTLVAGTHRVPVWNNDGGIWIDKGQPTTKHLRVTAVDLTPKAPGGHLLVEQPGTCDSDYSTWFDLAYGQHWKSIFGLKAAKLTRIWTTTTHDESLTMRRDGAWDLTRYACAKAAEYAGSWEDGRKAKVKRMGKARHITERFSLKGDGSIAKRVVRTRTVRSKCGGQRFCPYVYVGDPPRRVGEILTSQIGRAAWRDDRLRLPPVDGDHLVVRVAEEKFDEITFIDAVWLEVDGERRAPTNCRGAAWCAVDGRLHRLRPGEGITLRFAGLQPGQQVALGANGYYELTGPRRPSVRR